MRANKNTVDPPSEANRNGDAQGPANHNADPMPATAPMVHHSSRSTVPIYCAVIVTGVPRAVSATAMHGALQYHARPHKHTPRRLDKCFGLQPLSSRACAAAGSAGRLESDSIAFEHAGNNPAVAHPCQARIHAIEQKLIRFHQCHRDVVTEIVVEGEF